MNYAKFVSKSSFVILAAAVCTTLAATDASAQRRGGGSGGGGGQGRSGGGQGRSEGRAAPRGSVYRGGVGPRVGSARVIVRSPYRSYYYRPGFSLGIYAGYPYYGYGYPYGYYGSPYGYYGYPGYAYRGYGYPAGGYAYGGYGYVGGGAYGGYGGVRIQDAPPDAQVFADGYYAGVVDDFDGPFQHLDLEAGPHSIEIRVPGGPPISFDVNIQPGRNVTFHVR